VVNDRGVLVEDFISFPHDAHGATLVDQRLNVRSIEQYHLSSAGTMGSVGFAAVAMFTPVLQLVLIGSAALCERSNPRSTSFFYLGAALLLVPGLVMALA
jgi:hypothetical protein